MPVDRVVLEEVLKPIERIVGILELAQAVIAAGLGRPADARARPSTVLNNETEYSKVFDEKYPIAVYPQAALLLRACEMFLAASDLNRQDRNNLRFYLMRRALARAVGKLKVGVQDLAELEFAKVTGDVLSKSLDEIGEQYVKLGASDQVAKGPELERFVNENNLD